MMATAKNAGQEDIVQEHYTTVRKKNGALKRLESFIQNRDKDKNKDKEEEETVEEKIGKEEIEESENEDGDDSQGGDTKPDAEDDKNKDKSKEEQEDEELEESEEVEEEEDIDDGEVEKVRREADKAISKKHEKLLKSELALVELNPERLIQLANGDEGDVKLAKQISKKLDWGTLSEAIQKVEKALEEEGITPTVKREVTEEQIEKRIANKAIVKSFIDSHEVLNETSDKYDEAIRVEFDSILNSLVDIDEFANADDIERSIQKAYKISNFENIKDDLITEVKKQTKIQEFKKGQASKSSGGGQKGSKKPKKVELTAKEKLAKIAEEKRMDRLKRFH